MSETPDTQKTELRYVSFDDGPKVLAIADPSDRWNGWMKPLIMREDLRAIFSDTYPVYFDEENAYLGFEGVSFPMVRIPTGTHPEFDGLPAYDLRDAGFCFNDDGPCHF